MTRETFIEGCAAAATFAVRALVELGLAFAAVAERTFA